MAATYERVLDVTYRIYYLIKCAAKPNLRRHIEKLFNEWPIIVVGATQTQEHHGNILFGNK